MASLYPETGVRRMSRRQMLETAGLGLGKLALTSMLLEHPLLSAIDTPGKLFDDLKSRPAHHPGKAKAVIQLFQSGGPSQMEMFDPKPELVKRQGQPAPAAVETFQAGNNQVLLGPAFKFEKRGKCGMELSEVIPNIGEVADDLCLVRSMFTEHNNHPEGNYMMQTCKVFPGRPSIGAWISYALGTENENLPAYVVLRDPAGSPYKANWANGWLPAIFQGVEFNSQGMPVHHLEPEIPIPPGAQRSHLELLSKLNQAHRAQHPAEKELEARIRNLELAARMQLAVPEVLDLAKESPATRKLYGLDDPVTAPYSLRCLMARRLIESGVRYVQVFAPIEGWDHHGQIRKGLESVCSKVDRGTSALLQDLKSRGMLDSTIVLWTGEFGRLPITQGGTGRDHNRHGFSLMLAGGGFKAGYVHGATDDFGYKAAVKRVSVPDLHATLLWQMGIDHDQLSYPYHGIPETPTDAKVNGARVVKDLLQSPAA